MMQSSLSGTPAGPTSGKATAIESSAASEGLSGRLLVASWTQQRQLGEGEPERVHWQPQWDPPPLLQWYPGETAPRHVKGEVLKLK